MFSLENMKISDVRSNAIFSLTTSTCDQITQEEAIASVDCLLAHSLKKSRSYIHSHRDENISDSHLQTFTNAINRRAKGEPCAYITGSKEFYSIELHVNPDVLIPRPETELLVDACLSIVDNNSKQVAIIDLGTGSGAIALSLAYETQNTRLAPEIYAIDISDKALNVARSNAANLNLNKSVNFFKSDLLDDFFLGFEFQDLDKQQKQVVIIANLPYIPLDDKLPISVKEYEPFVALFGGKTGKELIYKTIQQSSRYLSRGDYLLLEIGTDQTAEVLSAINSANFNHLETIKDLAGIDRAIISQKL